MRRVLTAMVVAILAGSTGLRGDDTASAMVVARGSARQRRHGGTQHRQPRLTSARPSYVAAQFKKSGLEPAGVGGYIQPVAFKTRKIDESKSSLTLVKNGKTEPLTLGEDANISVRVDPAPLPSTRRSCSSATACTSPSATSTTSPA